MAIKYIPDEKTLKKIREIAADGGTLSQIACLINKDRCCVKRLLKDYNIDFKPSQRNKMGRKYDWGRTKMEKLKEMYSSPEFGIRDIAVYFGTSTQVIMKKAKEMNLVKVKKAFFTEEENNYLKENYKTKTITKMSEELGKCNWSISRQLSDLNLELTAEEKRSLLASCHNYKGSYHTVLEPPTKEYEQDIANPALSHAFIARKYGVSVATASKWRKNRFGTFKQMVDTFLNKTTAEIDLENILIDLDLSYIYEKDIGKWKVDYYLGFKCLVEVYGSYWHTDVEKIIKRDKRKNRDLKENGYSVIIVWDYELKNVDIIKDRILSTLKTCIDRYYNGSRNLVDL